MANVTAEFAVERAEIIADMKRASNAQDTARWVASEARRTRDAAARVGTDVHALCDAIARGETVETNAVDAPYIDGFRRWLEATGPRIVATERLGANLALAYAGTFDLIAEFEGARWLIDIKTSKSVYAETAGQLAAYSKFDFLGAPDDPVRHPMPICSRFGVLHLRPGGARLVEFRPRAETWQMFQGALSVSKWLQGEAKTVMVGGKAA
jgi:hypothetical protein